MDFNFVAQLFKPEFPKDLRGEHIRTWRTLDADKEMKETYLAVYALTEACRRGDKDTGEYLLAYMNVPPNGLIGVGDAPLYAAIDAKNTQMVELLRDYNVNLRPWDLDKHSLGMPADIEKILYRDEPSAPPAKVRPLSELGVWKHLDVHPKEKQAYINTLALCGAINRYAELNRRDDAGVAEYLLYRENTPVNGVAGLENAPIIAAQANRTNDMVELLKKYGAKVEANTSKQTAKFQR